MNISYTNYRSLGTIGVPGGSGRGQLNKLYGLTTDLNGFIIVAEYGNNCVAINDSNVTVFIALAPGIS